MAYVKVQIIAPNGKRFEAQIDAEADSERLLEDLVAAMKLPRRRYNLNLVNSTKLAEGALLKISEAEPQISEVEPRKIVRLLE